MNEKKWKNIWRILQKTLIFAPLLERSTKSLDYGVMAAQQVLVLFVLVRIQVVQRKSQSFKVKPRKNVVFAGFAFFRKLRAMKMQASPCKENVRIKHVMIRFINTIN